MRHDFIVFLISTLLACFPKKKWKMRKKRCSPKHTAKPRRRRQPPCSGNPKKRNRTPQRSLREISFEFLAILAARRRQAAPATPFRSFPKIKTKKRRKREGKACEKCRRPLLSDLFAPALKNKKKSSQAAIEVPDGFFRAGATRQLEKHLRHDFMVFFDVNTSRSLSQKKKERKKPRNMRSAKLDADDNWKRGGWEKKRKETRRRTRRRRCKIRDPRDQPDEMS